MKKVLTLMDEYFAFLYKFTDVYNKYSCSDDKRLIDKIRELSNLNNMKVNEIHESIGQLSLDERKILLEQVNVLMEELDDEKKVLNFRLKSIGNDMDSKRQEISDRMGVIEHKIYCYERIIISYMEEMKFTKKMTN